MIDVIKLGEQADEFADAKIAQPGEFHPDWHRVRDERFAELVLEEAAKVCQSRYMGDHSREDQEALRCAAAILAIKPTERQS